MAMIGCMCRFYSNDRVLAAATSMPAAAAYAGSTIMYRKVHRFSGILRAWMGCIAIRIAAAMHIRIWRAAYMHIYSVQRMPT